MIDREPQPSDGPDYWADHACWSARNKPALQASSARTIGEGGAA